MRVVHTFAEARDTTGVDLALVPTMGYLHEGHLSLIEKAKAETSVVCVSIFVNPTQFDAAADLSSYPRDLERDLALCEAAGVDTVLVPSAEEVYPEPLDPIDPGPAAEGMEGAHRPGHFEGVATVVHRFLTALDPHHAYFGRKDAQQVAVIRTMAAEHGLDVEIVPGSTVREQDGLALSSRNVRLGLDRARAVGISESLFAAADAAEAGERSAAGLQALVELELQVRGLQPEYVTLADAVWMKPVGEVHREAVLATAVPVGDVRLIDNIVLAPAGPGVVVDRGVRLDRPSILYR